MLRALGRVVYVVNFIAELAQCYATVVRKFCIKLNDPIVEGGENIQLNSARATRDFRRKAGLFMQYEVLLLITFRHGDFLIIKLKHGGRHERH